MNVLLLPPEEYKTCPMCGFVWPTRDAFLADPALELIGYQANFKRLELGIFLFNHTCKATLGVQAATFWDLHQGAVFMARATGSDQCPEYCLHQEVLDPCRAQCECAFVREILQVIKNWPRKPPDGGLSRSATDG